MVEVALASAVALHRVEAHLAGRDALRAVAAADHAVHAALDGQRARLDQLGDVVDLVERVEPVDAARIGDRDHAVELPVVARRQRDALRVGGLPHHVGGHRAAEVSVELGHRLVGCERARRSWLECRSPGPIRPHARLAWSRDRDAGSAVRRDRPRALVVRERAAAERAHQARARPAPLPGQVPAAAGGGADPPPLPGGRSRARPVLRLGHDARRGRRPRSRRGGLRHLGLQRAALGREDATARRRRGRCRAGRDARARREPRRARRPATCPPIWPSGTARKRGGSCSPIAARSSRAAPGAASPRSC